MGTKFKICKVKKFWRSVSQKCELTEQHWTLHLKIVKMANFLLCIYIFLATKKYPRGIIRSVQRDFSTRMFIDI